MNLSSIEFKMNCPTSPVRPRLLCYASLSHDFLAAPIIHRYHTPRSAPAPLVAPSPYQLFLAYGLGQRGAPPEARAWCSVAGVRFRTNPEPEPELEPEPKPKPKPKPEPEPEPHLNSGSEPPKNSNRTPGAVRGSQISYFCRMDVKNWAKLRLQKQKSDYS